MAFAFSFDSDLSFADILARLNARGPWQWSERDSAWYGNLASARTSTLKLDVLESGPNETGGRVDAGNGQRYAISVRPSSSAPSHAEWDAVRASVRALLQTLDARDVKPTDTID